ncbi:DUF835 domain-containing protein [Thermococcus sp. M39]|uniref:DUF835 domain-containing protein n=1 Tax=unclassified Thermococcus TaxID=2627626 RepID=UPI00143AC754|nr:MULTISPECIES: DUF835 domain-containing protein [unclassified Thermococcus]NJE09036.1 DUF835 domain-containing protein [Thermococcus sp. M39]NJE13299.1 DUF835 domain-containing protein [Thermococcus sp. LS2]
MIGIYDEITFVSDVVNFIFVLIVFVVTFRYRHAFVNKFPSLKGFYYTILVSLGIAVVGNVIDVFDNLIIQGRYLGSQFTDQLTSWIYAITIAFIGIGWINVIVNIVEKYNPVPVVREDLEKTVKVHLDSGLYICTDENKCYTYFKALLAERPGLVISRNPPEIVRKALGLRETPILWLTKVERKDTVYPTNLPYLMQTLVNFMKKEGKPKVILLEGLEYLTTENGFKSIFKFLTTLKDYALVNNSIIIIPIESKAYDDRDIHLLLREFKVIS